MPCTHIPDPWLPLLGGAFTREPLSGPFVGLARSGLRQTATFTTPVLDG